MIPLVDDYLQLFIVEKLRWLKEHTVVIDHIFSTGKRETLTNLKNFIENRKIRVLLGYPREAASLPCYVITLAPEQEQPIGLGDDFGCVEFDELGFDSEDEEQVQIQALEQVKGYLSNTYMNSNYRIECWSDNGDLTSYMYILLKWCLWTSRQQMLNLGWGNIKMSGTDLEPVPDYMSLFVYRRSAQLSLMYENLYYEHIEELEKYLDVITNPDNYTKDEQGNIVNGDNEVVVSQETLFILRPHYHQEQQTSE